MLDMSKSSGFNRILGISWLLSRKKRRENRNRRDVRHQLLEPRMMLNATPLSQPELDAANFRMESAYQYVQQTANQSARAELQPGFNPVSFTRGAIDRQLIHAVPIAFGLDPSTAIQFEIDNPISNAGADLPTDPIGQLATPFELDQTFSLHSNLGANHTVYLDFNGNGNDEAYNFAGGVETFTDAELTQIQLIWQRVTEDFAPFNLDITTQEPASGALIKSGFRDTQWGVRVVITDGDSASGGWAYLNSFNWNYDQPVYVHTLGVGTGNKNIAEVISHEIGHSLGLEHDGNSSTSYFNGFGSGATGWAPIMGVGYYKNVTQWSKGEYFDANQTQDDLSIITSRNGFGYRVDDYGNNQSTATLLEASQVAGIIERNTDFDVFKFNAGDGDLTLVASAFYEGANLDIGLALYDSSFSLIASASPLNDLDASLTTNVTAGTYYISVAGTGNGDNWNSQKYGDYGSLGQYTLVLSGSATLATPNPSTFTASSNVVVPITDSGTSTISSTINVSGVIGRIDDLDVGLNITHTRDEDLAAYLISPAGTRVELFSEIGGGADDFINTNFSDEATTAINDGSAPFAGTFRPNDLLSWVDGEDPNGTWTLEVQDNSNQNGGSLNQWSLTITVPTITNLNSRPLGPVNHGIAVNDRATGTGFLLHSVESVFSRFAAAPPYANNSNNLIAVRYHRTQWQYNDNNLWHDFTPASTDRLLAEVDFTNDTITSLQGQSGQTQGIDRGYVSGDLTFTINQWNGVSNPGEFTIEGTGFEVPAATNGRPLGPVNYGIAVDDAATGTGFILYSVESVFSRFATAAPYANNSNNLIAVRYNGAQWQYNDNLYWRDFTPFASDRLLASVNFTNDTITSLIGQAGQINGVDQGYESGDLNFLANRWNGVGNRGEFTIEGTGFEVPAPTNSRPLGSVNYGIAVSDAATGTGYILYSVEGITSRFAAAPPYANNSNNLIAVRYFEAQWQYNDNNQWHELTLAPGDLLLAEVDFTRDTITTLLGQSGQFNGIDRGYVSGDLTFTANQWKGVNNPGEFTIEGTQFVPN
jgi:subtilisin-like proprotein convertase family protein